MDPVRLLSVKAGMVDVPVKVGLANGAAPSVLYDNVTAAEPLNVDPEAAPLPALFRVSAFVVVPLPAGVV